MNIRKIACGLDHTAFISSIYFLWKINWHFLVDGNVYTFGSNAYGKLGIGEKTMNSISQPQIIERLIDLKINDISCGDNHTIAVS